MSTPSDLAVDESARLEPIPEATEPPSRRIRAWLAIAAGILSGARALMFAVGESRARDFDQVRYAAHAMLAGRNPYAEIGPGLPFDWNAYFYYPLSAVIAVFPITMLARTAAVCAFAGLSGAAFVYAATRRSLAPAVVITSASAAMAAETAQWSPLLGAAFGLPWLGIFLNAKPTIGLAVFIARPTRIAIVGGLVLAAIALAIQPDWPAEWLAAIHHTSLLTPGGTLYAAPIATLGGAFALLALLRWRRPEARLLLALACVPQTTLLYETVPLFLIPTTIVEGGILWLGSWLVAAWVHVAGPFPTDPERFIASGKAMGWLMYLPCAIMVWRRPNVGYLPSWLDEKLSAIPVPAWLRGAQSAD